MDPFYAICHACRTVSEHPTAAAAAAQDQDHACSDARDIKPGEPHRTVATRGYITAHLPNLLPLLPGN